MTNPRRDAQEANYTLLVATLRAQRDAERATGERDLFHALVEDLTEGIIVIDASHRILLMNSAARTITGLVARAPLDSQSSTALAQQRLDGTALPFDEWPVCRALRGEHFDDEEVLVAGRGRPRNVAFGGNAIHDGDGVVAAIVTCRDVTELRQLERMREEDAALISHDLRNPLSVLLAATRRLERSGALNGGPEAELLEFITTSAERINTMVTDLVERTYLENSGVGLRQEPVALRNTIERVVKTFASADETHEFLTVIDGQSPLVLADEGRIERVLGNLMSNAAKHSEPDAPITISLAASGGSAVVSVHDEGTGISAEDLPYLFERFYHGSPDRAPHKSYGLGLYVSRLIVAAHGGEIWVESTPGEGSTFSFTLPMAFGEIDHSA